MYQKPIPFLNKMLILTLAALFSASFTPFARGQEAEPIYIEEDSDAIVLSDVANATYEEVTDASPESAEENFFTPDYAYRQLAAGNARYLKEASEDARTLPKYDVNEYKYPLATVLYSLDMPTLPTTLTQTTDREIYLAGIQAGAVSTDDLAAIEYGLLNLQTPLLVVMGHYPSSEVSKLIRNYDQLESKAKKETAKLVGQDIQTLPQGTSTDEMKLYNLIGPAIARSKEAYPDLQGYDLANVVSEALVWQSVETILMKSTAAQDLVRAGQLSVIAGIVDDKTGKIYWLGEHPLQEEFLSNDPKRL